MSAKAALAELVVGRPRLLVLADDALDADLLAERYREPRGLRRPPPIPEELQITPTEPDYPELPRMLAGTKPVSMFGDVVPEDFFQPHVDRGAVLRLDLAFAEVCRSAC
jgi:hypothetical protein